MTQHDPALLSAALAGAEQALNQAIALAPYSHQELDAVSGTLLGIEITTLDLTVYIEMVTDTEVRLMAHCERDTDAFCAARSKTSPRWRPPTNPQPP